MILDRIPIYPDTKPRLHGSQLFFVNPLVLNDGTAAPLGGSVINYPYTLPFTAHNFPVRRIRFYNPANLTVAPPLAFGSDQLLTLRKADGTYLLHDCPIVEFVDTLGIGGVLQRQLLFDDDFFPDPRMSYVKYMQNGATARLALQFHY